MFLDFSMVEIPFTYHDIHLLEGHDLMDFRKLMDLWTPHGNLLLEDFYHSKRKASAYLLSPLVSTLNASKPAFCRRRCAYWIFITEVSNMANCGGGSFT